MRAEFRIPFRVAIVLGALLGAGAARGADPAAPAAKSDVPGLLAKLTEGTPKATKSALEALGRSREPKLIEFFKEYYMKDDAWAYQGKVVLKGKVAGDNVTLLDPLTRQPLADAAGKPLVAPVADVKAIEASRAERNMANAAVGVLQIAERLGDPNPEARLAAVLRAGDKADASTLPILRDMVGGEKDKAVRRAIEEGIARIEFELGAGPLINRHQDAVVLKNRLRFELGRADEARRKEIEAELAPIDAGLKDAADETKHPEEAERRTARLAAAAKLGELQSLRALTRLKDAQAAEVDPAVAAQYDPAIKSIERWQTTVDWSGYLFSGLSAGSILILVALGLSIIFGVMGVINMAQGELVMIGAYSTYVTQLMFGGMVSKGWISESAFDWYFAVAIPLSFLITATVGMVIEATVVRRLYGRPLDTLLATFGIGLILTQAVRAYFGDNIGVKAPRWLQGGWEVVPDIVLPYARIFAIGFCVACIVLMYFIISKTKLGLLLRATTQNRQMAGALGVPTKRVDLLTFGLGAGLAGMAGCALTPIEGVTPSMGQNYIIDSFLVVVTGGVGKLAGAIWAGSGLGMLNKLLEPIFQTVWAKVIILGTVVMFLQWRPSGLFPAKGRLADV